MNSLLFKAADFLSRPPGFYVVMGVLVFCSVLVPLGLTDVITFALSVAAIVITGVVLIQGYRDTAAIHAKLDEIIVALRETRNDVVGLEHSDPKEIQAVVERLEEEASVLAEAAETNSRVPRASRDTDRQSAPIAETGNY
jgi:low affinity Fe/Cu permease